MDYRVGKVDPVLQRQVKQEKNRLPQNEESALKEQRQTCYR